VAWIVIDGVEPPDAPASPHSRVRDSGDGDDRPADPPPQTDAAPTTPPTPPGLGRAEPPPATLAASESRGEPGVSE
jgi:hypothetical protein